MTLIGLHALLWNKDQILMGERRRVVHGAGQYNLPCGKLEMDESVVAGMRREIREECGVTVAPEAFELVYSQHFRADAAWLMLFFSVQRWVGEIENREPEKCAGWEWIDRRALPANVMPYARAALDDILAGARFGLFGWGEES